MGLAVLIFSEGFGLMTFFSYSYSLGLDIPGLFGLTTTTIDSVLIPTRVKSVKSRINDIAMGPNHTVCLTDDGKGQ